MNKFLLKYYQGSALISALFIISLVAITATAMSVRLHHSIYNTHRSMLSDKLYLASQAATFWSIEKLTQSKTLPAIDDKGKILEFPSRFHAIYPEFILKASVYDLQSRFNLNNLADKKYHNLFLKLLLQLSPKLSPKERKSLLLAIQHWIGFYQLDHGQDEFFHYYLTHFPAYFPSKQKLYHLSEFRLIKPVNASLYTHLSLYFTALPEVLPININTVSKTLLSSLGKESVAIQALLEARGKKGIQRLDTIRPLLEKLHLKREQLTTESHYFLTVTEVSHAELNLTIYTLLRKITNLQGKPSVRIMNVSLNVN